MKIVTILPAYNLEEEIPGIVERTKQYSDIVIVVSDGSTDKTHEKATKAGALCPEETDKLGMGFAVRKGIEYSKQFRPDVVVLMDADGQHLPEEIPKVIAPIIKEDVDTVIGSRTMGVLRTSTINRIGNFGLKLISFFVTGRWFTDTESGFRAYKAAKLYELDLEAEGYEIESDLFLKSLHKGHSIREVPITVPKAVPGVTVIDGLKMGIFKIRLGIKLKLLKENK